MSLSSIAQFEPSETGEMTDTTQGDGAVLGPALDALFRTEAPLLVRRLSRKTASSEEAMDLVQDAFLLLLRASPDGEIRNPAAYLQRIVQNLLKKRARQAATRSLALHDPLDQHVIPDRSPRQDEVFLKRELLERYEAAVLRLPLKTRHIFLLHRRGGLTYAEIAEIVGLTISGVEKHMMKAIATLDRCLGAS